MLRQASYGTIKIGTYQSLKRLAVERPEGGWQPVSWDSQGVRSCFSPDILERVFNYLVNFRLFRPGKDWLRRVNKLCLTWAERKSLCTSVLITCVWNILLPDPPPPPHPLPTSWSFLYDPETNLCCCVLKGVRPSTGVWPTYQRPSVLLKENSLLPTPEVLSCQALPC